MSEPKSGDRLKVQELREVGKALGKELSKGTKMLSKRIADLEVSQTKRQNIPGLPAGHRDKLVQLKLEPTSCVGDEEKLVDFRRLIGRNMRARLGEQGDRIHKVLDKAVQDYEEKYKASIEAQ